MNRKKAAIGLAFILPLLVATYIFSRQSSPYEEKTSTTNTRIVRKISYGFEVKNTSDVLLENVAVSVFTPLHSAEFQERLSITSRPVAEILENEVRFTLSIPPYGFEILTVESEVALVSHSPSNEAEISSFLEEEPFIEFSDESIQERARALKKTSDKKTARAIYSWVRDSIRSTGYAKEAKGASHALREKQGDCTEFSSLVVALARSLKIPARVVSGFHLTKNRFVRPIDFHSWAELYVDGNWTLYDAHKGISEEQNQNYIAFGSVDNVKYSITPNRFFAHSKDISVRMR